MFVLIYVNGLKPKLDKAFIRLNTVFIIPHMKTAKTRVYNDMFENKFEKQHPL